MRVLALADRPFHADVAKLAANYDVDAIVTLGDLQPSWLESLDKCCQPKLGVYGNHDDAPYMTYFGIDNLHMNRIQLDNGHETLGYMAGKMKRYRIRIGLGDRVKIELSPYDLERGRIVYRLS